MQRIYLIVCTLQKSAIITIITIITTITIKYAHISSLTPRTAHRNNTYINNVSSTNSKFFNKRNFVAWFYRKLFTMTRKFNPENLNFLVIF